jgi:DNA polymerase-4
MDAFFASVELLFYPELRGLPVVVGGARVPRPQPLPEGGYQFARLKNYAGRGVVTTATYEARASGVSSGMGLTRAARILPEALLLPANFEAYREYSRRFKAAVRAIAPRMEDRGIDEIFLDLSEIAEESLPLARRLQTAVREATGLSCSLGVAPNRLLAKIASDMQKPGGVTLLAAEDIPARLWPMPTQKINGIGGKTAARLAELKIFSIGDLAAAPLSLLARHFGARQGNWLSRAAQGMDDSPLVTFREAKSLSREITFERDLHLTRDRAELSRQLETLCQRLSDDLARKKVQGGAVGVKIRFADFRLVTRETSLSAPVSSPETLCAAARQCLKRLSFAPPERRLLRLLGVRASHLQAISRGGDPPPQPTRAAQAELPLASEAADF